MRRADDELRRGTRGEEEAGNRRREVLHGSGDRGERDPTRVHRRTAAARVTRGVRAGALVPPLGVVAGPGADGRDTGDRTRVTLAALADSSSGSRGRGSRDDRVGGQREQPPRTMAAHACARGSRADAPEPHGTIGASFGARRRPRAPHARGACSKFVHRRAAMRGFAQAVNDRPGNAGCGRTQRGRRFVARGRPFRRTAVLRPFLWPCARRLRALRGDARPDASRA